MKTYYIVEAIPSGRARKELREKELLLENIAYGLGYCFGCLRCITKWAIVGAALTFIVHCIIH